MLQPRLVRRVARDIALALPVADQPQAVRANSVHGACHPPVWPVKAREAWFSNIAESRFGGEFGQRARRLQKNNSDISTA